MINDFIDSNSEKTSSKRPNVHEIHVDFLLWEELTVNREFLSSFIEFCNEYDDLGSLKSVEHSVSNHLGETDLELRYISKSGETVGILIEDKIGATFQPEQAKRYKQRGELGKTDSWKRYITCLVAPEKYIVKGHDFMKAISLEQLCQWIDTSDNRSNFKIEILKAAIEKEQTSGAKVVDDDVTNFRLRYFELLNKSNTDLIMNKPKPSYSGETWFTLNHSKLHKFAYIYHKSERGFVDLTFRNTIAEDMHQIEPLLEKEMSIQQTGKSTAIRIKVSSIDDFKDFDIQIDNLNKAYNAAMQLIAFFQKEKRLILNILENKN